MIVSARQLEVFVEETQTEPYLMSLYELGGVTCATFTAEDESSGAWIPIPPPSIFTQNPDTFEVFKQNLEKEGYTYRNPCATVQ